jgi:MFS family permease
MDRSTVRRLAAYVVAFLSSGVASQIQGIAVAWHVFTLHHRPFDLGLVGLTLFLPSFLLVLITGLVADRFDRKSIMIVTALLEMVTVGAFLALVITHVHTLWPYLLTLLGTGTALAFGAPAQRGLLLVLIPQSEYMRVSAAYASVRQFVAVGSPAAGGALVALGTSVALGTAIALLAVSIVGLLALRVPARVLAANGSVPTLRDALGGLHFIRAQPIILAAISLDLFAVLFGGATALLPAYADTILRVGPVGLGLLRAAPAVGAAASAAYLARYPLRANVGRSLLIAVAIFGVATVVFGVSRSFGLSLVALAITGASDMVSVVVRTGLVQLATPDAMRGRVNAVENVFIGASNELGEFESGMLAALIGVVPSVVVGGIGTMIVVAICSAVFPQLRRLNDFARAPA